MKDLLANSLLPFVPSGKDYEASRRLFAELGFEERWESDGYAGFRNGGAEFILQRFDDEHFAQNFMVRLNVDDLDRWWAHISQKSLDRTYPGVRFSMPFPQPAPPNGRLKLAGPAIRGRVRLCASPQIPQHGALAPAGARPAA